MDTKGGRGSLPVFLSPDARSLRYRDKDAIVVDVSRRRAHQVITRHLSLPYGTLSRTVRSWTFFSK